jgi:predicted transcriptional regulator
MSELEVYQYVEQHPTSSYKDLLANLNIQKSKFKVIITNLIDYGLIKRHRRGYVKATGNKPDKLLTGILSKAVATRTKSGLVVNDNNIEKLYKFIDMNDVVLFPDIMKHLKVSRNTAQILVEVLVNQSRIFSHKISGTFQFTTKTSSVATAAFKRRNKAAVVSTGNIFKEFHDKPMLKKWNPYM